MSRHYHPLAFTDHVLDAQVRYGSRAALDRLDRRDPPGDGAASDGPRAGAPGPLDPLTEAEREFVSARDGFYLATVSDTGWPYVQFRGGPPGFVSSPDEHTLAWADFRGNRQYVSTGNLAYDQRVALIFMDYPHQLRLKVFGVASVTAVPGGATYSGPLAVPGYRARVEREVRITVSAYDWNCPQHITPRYSAEELAPAIEPLQRRIAELEAENRRLRAATSHRGPEAPA